jgi:hypothetical protein
MTSKRRLNGPKCPGLRDRLTSNRVTSRALSQPLKPLRGTHLGTSGGLPRSLRRSQCSVPSGESAMFASRRPAVLGEVSWRSGLYMAVGDD